MIIQYDKNRENKRPCGPWSEYSRLDIFMDKAIIAYKKKNVYFYQLMFREKYRRNRQRFQDFQDVIFLERFTNTKK